MSARDLLWSRVNAVLDGGGDPLADPGVQEAIGQAGPAESRELLGELATALAALDAIARAEAERDELWTRIDAGFDDEIDHHQDPRFQELVARHPRTLDDLVRLQRRLRAIRHAVGDPRGTFRDLAAEALVDGRDPLLVPEVRRLVAIDPARGRELARMRARHDEEPGEDHDEERARVFAMPVEHDDELAAQRARRRRVAIAACAAFVVLGSAAAWLVDGLGGDDATQPAEVAIAAPPSAGEAISPRSEVLAFTAEVVIEGPDGRSVAIFDGRGARSSTQRSFLRSTFTAASLSTSTAPPAPPDPVRFVATVETLSTRR